jgi:hypothetical protein
MVLPKEPPYRHKGEVAPRNGGRHHPYRYGTSEQSIKDHAKNANKYLKKTYSRDEEGPEIIEAIKLKLNPHPTPTEYLAGRNGPAIRRICCTEYKKAVESEWSNEVCAQIYAYGGGTMRGYERGRRLEACKYDPDDLEWKKRRVDMGDGKLGVEFPTKKSERTLRRHRNMVADAIGIKPINDDGSAVAAYDFKGCVIDAILGMGLDWVERMMEGGFHVEVVISGDAHGGTAGAKFTSVCVTILGTCERANSPGSMRGLAHWLGGDDWENLHAYCTGVFEAIAEIKAANNLLTVYFPDESKTVNVKVNVVLCADAMFLDGDLGHDGFAGTETCPWCRVISSASKCNLHVEEDDKTTYKKGKGADRKDRKYVNNSHHLPENWPPKKGETYKFKSFACPHKECPRHKRPFKSLAEVNAEPDEDNMAPGKLREYKKKHGGMFPKRHKVRPVA